MPTCAGFDNFATWCGFWTARAAGWRFWNRASCTRRWPRCLWAAGHTHNSHREAALPPPTALPPDCVAGHTENLTRFAPCTPRWWRCCLPSCASCVTLLLVRNSLLARCCVVCPALPRCTVCHARTAAALLTTCLKCPRRRCTGADIGVDAASSRTSPGAMSGKVLWRMWDCVMTGA